LELRTEKVKGGQNEELPYWKIAVESGVDEEESRREKVNERINIAPGIKTTMIGT
jgi:hypothetical protein